MLWKSASILFLLGFWAVITVNAKPFIDGDLEEVLKKSPTDKELNIIVRLNDSPDFSIAKNRGLTRSNFLKNLKLNAHHSREVLKPFFKANPAKKVCPLWLINGLSLTADAGTIVKLARHPSVSSLTTDKTFHIPETVYSSGTSPTWNISQINADILWSLGFAGSGIIVGVMDTGADLDNPHLLPSYRGGSNSWFDPTGMHLSPHDSDGHGTQVLGIILGSNDIDTTIGIAPSAKWIAAKIFDDTGETSFSNIHLAFQWFLDPDNDPNTDDAPHIVNGSWGLRDNVDQCVVEFQQDVSILRQAGIIVVFAAGNESVNPSYPSSVSPANYPESLSVGSVSSTSEITFSSSRGPSACDGAIYPKLVAPGESIETCDLFFGGLFDQHVYVDGTSFAAPHVTGTTVLLLSVFPGLNGLQLEKLLTFSAVDLGIPGPDNSYGYGLVDAAQAYQLAVSLLAGDFDLSCEVNISDVIILANEWLNCERFDCISDINADGNVNFLDFAALANHFNNDSCLLSPDF
jgi:bacillopeptidase F